MKTILQVLTLLIITFSSVKSQDTISPEFVINKYIDAIGGEDKIRSIKNIQIKSIQKTDKATHNLSKKSIFPRLHILEREFENQKMIATVKDSLGVNKTHEGIFRMPQEQINRFHEGMSIYSELNYLERNYPMKYNGLLKLNNGIECYEIEITLPDGKKIYHEYNSNTGLLVMKVVPKEKIIILEYKDYNGLKLPFKYTQNGRLIEVQDVIFNSEMSSSDFNWNNDEEEKLIGRWEARTNKTDNEQIQVNYVEFHEDRGGLEGIGVLENEEVHETGFLRQSIVGWELLEDSIKLNYYDPSSKKLWSRYLIIEERQEKEITGYISDPEMDKEMGNNLKPIKMKFKKVK